MTDISQQPTPWAGFGYAPVRGLVDRHVSRFLRAQRKNMRRLFQERGHYDLFAQMEEIRRDPTRGFMQKNQSFQRIMNEHIARSSQAAPVTPTVGGVGVPDPERNNAGDGAGVVQHDGARADAAGGVPQVALADGDGIVIEE